MKDLGEVLCRHEAPFLLALTLHLADIRGPLEALGRHEALVPAVLEYPAPRGEPVVDALGIRAPAAPPPSAFLVALHQVPADGVAMLGRQRVPGDLMAAERPARKEGREDVERVAHVSPGVVRIECIEVGLGGAGEALGLVTGRPG